MIPPAIIRNRTTGITIFMKNKPMMVLKFVDLKQNIYETMGIINKRMVKIKGNESDDKNA